MVVQTHGSLWGGSSLVLRGGEGDTSRDALLRERHGLAVLCSLPWKNTLKGSLHWNRYIWTPSLTQVPQAYECRPGIRRSATSECLGGDGGNHGVSHFWGTLLEQKTHVSSSAGGRGVASRHLEQVLRATGHRGRVHGKTPSLHTGYRI